MYQYQQGTNPLESETLMDPIKVIIHTSTSTNTTSTTEQTVSVSQPVPVRKTREVRFKVYVLKMNKTQLIHWFNNRIQHAPEWNKAGATEKFNRQLAILEKQEAEAVAKAKRAKYNEEYSFPNYIGNFFDDMMQLSLNDLINKAPVLLEKAIAAKKEKEIKQAQEAVLEAQAEAQEAAQEAQAKIQALKIAAMDKILEVQSL